MGVEANSVIFDEEKRTCFNCWDCAGQERFSDLQQEYYIGARVIVICFSVNSPLEVKSIPIWIKMAMANDSNINIILMGTKYDLPVIKNLEKILTSYNKPFCLT